MRDGSWKVGIVVAVLGALGLLIKDETALFIIIVLGLAVAVLASAWHRAEKELTEHHKKEREAWEAGKRRFNG